MAILAELVDFVIGVDTHKDTHTAAVVLAVSGAVVDQAAVPATPAGYQQLLRLADRHDARRVWAIESTGGYGAGLTRFLAANAEQVVELDRPKGPPAATAPSPIRWTRPGRPAKPWPASSSPSPERPAIARHGAAAGRKTLRGPGGHRPPTPTPRAGGCRP
jgi:transposase